MFTDDINKEKPGGQAPDESPEEKAGEDQNTGEKKYTDKDVDEIIAKKLRKERSRWAKRFEESFPEDLIERERNITKRELELDARERMTKAGIPASFGALLDYTDREKFEASFQVLADAYGKTARDFEVKLYSRSAPTKGSANFSGEDKDEKIRDAFGLNKR